MGHVHNINIISNENNVEKDHCKGKKGLIFIRNGNVIVTTNLVRMETGNPKKQMFHEMKLFYN